MKNYTINIINYHVLITTLSEFASFHYILMNGCRLLVETSITEIIVIFLIYSINFSKCSYFLALLNSKFTDFISF